jgi:thiamine-monophosphate kinase
MTRPEASGFTETSLVDYIQSRLPPSPPWLRVPIGDDAAVVEPPRGELEVLTTDTLVEGVHFDFAFCDPADVGVKALAVNLSDLASMGAEPRLALLSLSVPAAMGRDRLEPLLDAALASAADHRVAVVGGNVTASPGPLVITMAAAGAVRPRRALLRSGGRAGDDLYVSGTIGAGAAGLGLLRNGRRPADADDAECIGRYRRPEPRVRLGLLLGRTRTASACIDLSDGLADGVRRLAQGSGTGAALQADAIPIHPGARRYFRERGLDPVAASIAGGDDYELLFSVPAKRRRALASVVKLARGLAVTRIGSLTKDQRVVLRRGESEEPLPEGFRHF